MIKEIKIEKLMNVERKPIFYIKLDNEIIASIYAGTVGKVTTDDKRIMLFKDKDEVIDIKRYIKINDEITY